MNNKDDIENYLIELYRKTKNYNFDKFVETIFHYNVKIGDYKKPISFDLQNLMFELLNEEYDIKPEVRYWNNSNWSNVFILFNRFFKYYNKVILDFPIFDYDLNIACPPIIKYIIYNKITAKVSVHKKIKNPSLKIELYDINDANNIIDFFESNRKTNSLIKSRVVPFLIQKNLIGIYREYSPFDFKNYYIKNLYEYFSLCREEKEITISKFTNYINRLYRFEKKSNEKRMLRFLSDYLYMYDDTSKYERLFSCEPNMEVIGQNHNDYLFIANPQGDMNFVLKEDKNEIVTYGSELFFYLVYSKFYDNYIKRQDIYKYYDDFNGIYDSILSKNFENINIILDLVKNNNMNIVYKEMYVIASGYYAYRKIGIPFNIVKSIIDKIIIKIREENN